MGVLHGEERAYYKNGQLWYIKNWVHDKINGEHKVWNEDGKIMSVMNFVDGFPVIS